MKKELTILRKSIKKDIIKYFEYLAEYETSIDLQAIAICTNIPKYYIKEYLKEYYKDKYYDYNILHDKSDGIGIYYNDIKNKNIEYVFLNFKNKKIRQHQYIISNICEININDIYKKYKFVIHHVDKNKLNNGISNLMLMTEDMHALYHSAYKNIQVQEFIAEYLFKQNFKYKAIYIKALNRYYRFLNKYVIK